MKLLILLGILALLSSVQSTPCNCQSPAPCLDNHCPAPFFVSYVTFDPNAFYYNQSLQLTVVGTGLENIHNVTSNGAICQFVSATSTQIICNTPPFTEFDDNFGVTFTVIVSSTNTYYYTTFWYNYKCESCAGTGCTYHCLYGNSTVPQPCTCPSISTCGTQGRCRAPPGYFYLYFIDVPPIVLNEPFIVYISGANFNNDVTVTVNGAPCPITSLATYAIECLAEPYITITNTITAVLTSPLRVQEITMEI